MRVWNANNGQPILTISNSEFQFNTVVMAPDGESFAIGGQDGVVRIYPTTAQGFLDVASKIAQKVP